MMNVIYCVICSKEVNKGTPVAELSCGHKFCNDCILEWAKKSQKCPNCWEDFHSICRIKSGDENRDGKKDEISCFDYYPEEVFRRKCHLRDNISGPEVAISVIFNFKCVNLLSFTLLPSVESVMSTFI